MEFSEKEENKIENHSKNPEISKDSDPDPDPDSDPDPDTKAIMNYGITMGLIFTLVATGELIINKAVFNDYPLYGAATMELIFGLLFTPFCLTIKELLDRKEDRVELTESRFKDKFVMFVSTHSLRFGMDEKLVSGSNFLYIEPPRINFYTKETKEKIVVQELLQELGNQILIEAESRNYETKHSLIAVDAVDENTLLLFPDKNYSKTSRRKLFKDKKVTSRQPAASILLISRKQKKEEITNEINTHATHQITNYIFSIAKSLNNENILREIQHCNNEESGIIQKALLDKILQNIFNRLSVNLENEQMPIRGGYKISDKKIAIQIRLFSKEIPILDDKSDTIQYQKDIFFTLMQNGIPEPHKSLKEIFPIKKRRSLNSERLEDDLLTMNKTQLTYLLYMQLANNPFTLTSLDEIKTSPVNKIPSLFEKLLAYGVTVEIPDKKNVDRIKSRIIPASFFTWTSPFTATMILYTLVNLGVAGIPVTMMGFGGDSNGRHQRILQQSLDVSEGFPESDIQTDLVWRIESHGGMQINGYYITDTVNKYQDGKWIKNVKVKGELTDIPDHILPADKKDQEGVTGKSTQPEQQYVAYFRTIAVTNYGMQSIKLPMREYTRLAALQIVDDSNHPIRKNIFLLTDNTVEITFTIPPDSPITSYSISSYLVPDFNVRYHATSKINLTSEEKKHINNDPSTAIFNKFDQDAAKIGINDVQYINDWIAYKKLYSIDPDNNGKSFHPLNAYDFIKQAAALKGMDCTVAVGWITFITAAEDDNPSIINPAIGYHLGNDKIADTTGAFYLQSDMDHMFTVDQYGNVFDPTPKNNAKDARTQRFLSRASLSPGVLTDAWNKTVNNNKYIGKTQFQDALRQTNEEIQLHKKAMDKFILDAAITFALLGSVGAIYFNRKKIAQLPETISREAILTYFTLDDLQACSQMMEWVAWTDQKDKMMRKAPESGITKELLLENIYRQTNIEKLHEYISKSQKENAVRAGLSLRESILFQAIALKIAAPFLYNQVEKKTKLGIEKSAQTIMRKLATIKNDNTNADSQKKSKEAILNHYTKKNLRVIDTLMQEIARNDQNERIIRNRRHGEMTNEALLDNIYKNANHANLASYIINSQKKTAVLAGLTSHESLVFQIFAIIHASPDAFTPFTKKLLFNYLTIEDLTLCNEMMQWVSWSNKSEKIPRQQPAIVMTKDEILESMDKDINSAGLDLYLAHFHKDSHAAAGFTQRESILFQAMVITLASPFIFE